MKIPFFFTYRNTLIYKRVKFKGDNIISTVKIYYKLDSFTYKIINIEFSMNEYTAQQIKLAIELTITNLDKIYR
jgi:hypothetical protein